MGHAVERFVYTKLMPHPSAHHGDDAVDVVIDRIKPAAFRRLAHDAPELVGPGKRCLPLGDKTPLVGSDSLTCVNLVRLDYFLSFFRTVAAVSLLTLSDLRRAFWSLR